MENLFCISEITACESEEYEAIIRDRLEKQAKIEQQNALDFDTLCYRKEAESGENVCNMSNK